jgi:endonuclease YncB( thermonuclease family)
MHDLRPLFILGGIIFLFFVFGVGQKTKRHGKALKVGRKERPALTSVNVSRRAQETISGKAYIIDGDSLVIRKQELRLFGVDAPEFDHPYGKSAKSALIQLCNGHVIRAEIVDTDIYGRKVARCTLPDGRDLSAEMVKLGLAIDWAKFSGGVYRPFEIEGVRRKLWLADARQKGRMDVWEKYAQSKKK